MICAFGLSAKSIIVSHADATMKQTIQDILEIFREEAASNRDLGDKFERLIASFLTKDPYYANHFSNVWLWMEWPGRNNQPDTGIDLVAQERATGDFTAIQCKFLDPSHWLQKEDIDSFFTASGKKPFTQRMIICTTDKWGKHAEEALNNQQPPVIRLRFQDLDDSVIDWSSFNINRPQQIKRKPPNLIREHQKAARADVVAGFKTADRGKLIMACGTGKTFTALKIAEELVPAGGNVLFLVPSISLISQTFWEWSAQSENLLNSFAVCSDAQVGKKKNDEEDIRTHELSFPAHTDERRLVNETSLLRAKEKKNLNVIFSTYQSIAVISKAQKLGLPEFDLVICDEAHRTTGVEQTELSQKEASAFVAVHDVDFLKAKKRLYMTATPRIYDDASKGKAKDLDIQIYSMDDPEVYGAELHRLDFSKAIDDGLLCDYKVLVLAVDKLHVSTILQQQFAKYGKEFTLDDAVKIVGCWNGLRKRFIKQEGDGHEAIDPSPMRRAVAFSSRIADSEKIRDYFTQIIKDYTPEGDSEESKNPDFLKTEARHVDGKTNSLVRSDALQWLKADTTADGNVCRILSNARCLSEGVDVPALDAVMFLNPRKSQVDVVQAVGRVMRTSRGTKKQYGYIILPIVVPDGVSPEEALDDNERYKVVWQVLQALRAHDNRFNDIINQIDLNKGRTDKIITDFIGGGGDGEKKPGELNDKPAQTFLNFPLKDWEDKIFAKIVIKCGSRKPWEQWAKEVADIANTHIARIKGLLQGADPVYRKKFDAFLAGLRKTLNPSISENNAIEMLAQHLITKPVFDALFEGYEFTKHNPVSKTMQKMLDLLEGQNLDAETKSLENFYESIRKKARSAQGIDNLAAKQTIIRELYEKFFKTAFKDMSDRLGIVYTPVEVVDFMLKSVDDILREQFGVGLTAENVHVLDPFTGTGTYIVRLIQSGLIDDQDLARKFRGELHANEIVLLAYYIAAINIEEAYHARGKKDYEPFEGIVLTDTFQLSEGAGKFADESFQTNSKRAQAQQERDIRVIVGNPPYSAGQESQNDNNQNLKYPALDKRIENTYAEHSDSTNKNSLYNSYIRAIRWASDRVKDKGIICFVSDGSFIDGNAMSGLRKCFTDEFAAIYCFNLRGNARGTSGDYLTSDEKLNIVTGFQSVKKIPWETLTPNKNHDWINQRDEAFENFIPLGLKEEKGSLDAQAVFVMYSRGVATSRDAWAYNFSESKLVQNMKGMIERFNQQVQGYKMASAKGVKVKDFIDLDAKKISWSRGLVADVEKGKNVEYEQASVRDSYYRPFTKEIMYFNRRLNDMVYRMPVLFPKVNSENMAICIAGIGAQKDFSALIVNQIPNLHCQHTGLCFPLRYFQAPEKTDEKQIELQSAQGGWRENVSEFALKEFRAAYKDAKIGKEDIFYYVYGVLHSPEYKTRFAADLTKMLPRIPLAEDFWAFSQAGRDLAKIHLNYETAAPYAVKEEKSELALDESRLYLVEKMRFGKTVRTATAAPETDKTKIIYNGHITLTGIPPAAYDYIVNGKPAIEWIMDRYQLATDKDSGLTNNPNDWATEHQDPAYILNLLKRIITVSMATMEIVKALPALEERK